MKYMTDPKRLHALRLYYSILKPLFNADIFVHEDMH